MKKIEFISEIWQEFWNTVIRNVHKIKNHIILNISKFCFGLNRKTALKIHDSKTESFD